MAIKAALQVLFVGLTIAQGMAQTLTADMITNMGNNSLFTRWRSYSRIIAPAGWMNDPCGPMYDPNTGLYHAMYQWHPNHFGWGNISWGHVTSPDLISWTDVDHSPGQQPGIAAWQNNIGQAIGTTNYTSGHHTPSAYNHLGIWSGTAQPINITGQNDGTLTAFYTSISRLPLSWDTTYPIGAESQSLAYSYDGGITWTHYAGNPVIAYPPADWFITGFRDPFLFPSTHFDALLNYQSPHYYVIFGSGINQTGARAPLYSAPHTNLTQWTFLGALWEPALNSSLGDIQQTGTYGQQWEVPNIFDLDDWWYVSSGVQGGIASYRNFWNIGNVSTRSNGSILYTPMAGGAADWGNLYAITSFNDTKNNRRIQLGWSYDDTSGFSDRQRGANGVLSLPRVLYNLYTPNVTPPKSNVTGNSLYIKQSNGTYSALTLGAAPAPDVVAGLRRGSTYTQFYSTSSLTGRGLGQNSTYFISSMQSSYELSLIITSTTGLTGISLAASPDYSEYTSVYYDPSTNRIGVNRTYSSLIYQFANTTYSGYFAPYVNAQNNHTEPIHMRVFVDGSLVEVNVNERFWLTTRIFPSRADSANFGVYAAPGVTTTYASIEAWNGYANAFPSRPVNSSSLLVQDTAAACGNYTWWDGD